MHWAMPARPRTSGRRWPSLVESCRPHPRHHYQKQQQLHSHAAAAAVDDVGMPPPSTSNAWWLFLAMQAALAAPCLCLRFPPVPVHHVAHDVNVSMCFERDLAAAASWTGPGSRCAFQQECRSLLWFSPTPCLGTLKPCFRRTALSQGSSFALSLAHATLFARHQDLIQAPCSQPVAMTVLLFKRLSASDLAGTVLKTGRIVLPRVMVSSGACLFS